MKILVLRNDDDEFLVDYEVVRNFDDSPGAQRCYFNSRLWAVDRSLIESEEAQDRFVVLVNNNIGRSGENGVVCWSSDALDLLNSAKCLNARCLVFVKDIVGLLDDGLSFHEDFEIIKVFDYPNTPSELQSIHCGIQNMSWWTLVVALEYKHLQTLLRSNTVGYFLGAQVEVRGNEKFLLVRHAGYIDGYTDILLTYEYDLSKNKNVLMAF